MSSNNIIIIYVCIPIEEQNVYNTVLKNYLPFLWQFYEVSVFLELKDMSFDTKRNTS